MIQCGGVKGIVHPAMLFSPPFIDIDTSGISGVFDNDGSTKLIALVEEINQTAEVA